MFVRSLVLLAGAIMLAGCGTSSASSPTATPAATANPTLTGEPGARWHAYPAMTIKKTRHYTAVVQTNRGTFDIELLPKLAPLAVNSFVFLARHHYFDGSPFHRIIQTFMIQGGDPTGSGFGGPGYTFKDEIHKNLHYGPGAVAMANSGKDSNGSQFFIVTGTQGLQLQPSYTIFGRIIHGWKIVQKIAATPVTTNPAMGGEPSKPLARVYMKRVTIQESA